MFKRLKNYGGHFDIEKLQDHIKLLEQETLRENFWDQNQKAKDTLKNLESAKDELKKFQSIQQQLDDLQVLNEFFTTDPSEENEKEIKQAIEALHQDIERLQMAQMLSGELDPNGCYLEINAGAGGTESCDWASMLLRMYTRYAEKNNFKVSLISATEGEEAGYSSVTLQIDGSYAYGYLKAENGVHRLVRCSPFDANQRRHTSFVSVFVHPQVDDEIDIEIREEDIEMQAIRASGAGGQKVNKTSSAVRLTHIPTGIVVTCQMERSQHQNRATALKMLRARLYEIELQKKLKEKEKVEDSKREIGWGSQIRSYVLHPYKMIKDHRTDFETSNAQAVLDGDIAGFIKEYLLHK